ncbi:MAG: ubiquinone/menaquinone biosynthesis methyltransferase [Microthrixaceae bacterium]
MAVRGSTRREGEADLPLGTEKVVAVQSMFDTIAPRYDLVNRVMTFRMDVGWRRRAIAALGLRPGSFLVDLACGTGDFCHELADNGFRVLGVDRSHGMLAAAPRPFPRVQADALRLPLPDASVDGATCGFALRNFASLPPFFEELGRVVRPGGRIALLEVAEPPNRLLRAGHHVYFHKVVPRIGALLSDREAYRYLPRSVAYLPEADELLDQLRGVGFAGVERRLLSVGIAQLITATRDDRHDPAQRSLRTRSS